MPGLSWPHDDIIVSGSGLAGSEAEDIGRRCARAKWLMFQISLSRGSTRARLNEELSKLLFVLYNGTAVPYVGGKFQFGQIVSALEYRTPATVRYSHNQPADDLLVAVEALDTVNPLRFCKPLGGSKGRGIFVAQSPQAAVEFVSRQHRDYLIQAVLAPVAGDCRHILHRTGHDLEIEGPSSVRLAYERLGPTIVGNGHSTAVELIGRLKRSRTDKMKLAIGVASNWVPDKGEHIELVACGNTRYKKIRLLEGDRLEELDTFMLDFQAALEHYLGGQIATLCVDVGRTSNGIVLYEWQHQFVITPYRHNDRWQVAPVRRLRESMLHSGYVARNLQQ